MHSRRDTSEAELESTWRASSLLLDRSTAGSTSLRELVERVATSLEVDERAQWILGPIDGGPRRPMNWARGEPRRLSPADHCDGSANELVAGGAANWTRITPGPE